MLLLLSFCINQKQNTQKLKVETKIWEQHRSSHINLLSDELAFGLRKDVERIARVHIIDGTKLPNNSEECDVTKGK